MCLLCFLCSVFSALGQSGIPARAKHEYELGTRPQKDGKCNLRIEHLKKAVAIYPQYGDAFTELARCYLQMNDTPDAEAAFKNATRFSAGVDAAVNLATLYVNTGRADEAQAIIAPLLKKNPTEAGLYAAMARIYFAKGMLHETEVAVLEAHARGHHPPDIHLILAKIYQDQGKRQAQATQLLNYLDENPDGADAAQVRKQLQQLQDQ